MFVTHDKSVIKKKIQKPNILRRKPKTIILKTTDVLKPLLENHSDQFEHIDQNITTKNENAVKEILIHSMSSSEKVYETVIEDHNMLKDCQLIKGSANSKATNLLPTSITLEISNSNEDDLDQSLLNIDSFLIESSEQNTPYSSTLTQVKRDPVSQFIKTNDKLCFGFIDDTNRLVIEECGRTEEDFYLNQKSDVVNTMVPLSAISTLQDSNNMQIQTIKGYNMLSIEDLTQKSVRYKCDEPNCTKEFLNEQKLLKHKNTHNKECRAPRQTTLECPVKKINIDAMEIPCGRIFQVRGEMIKHLNEEHTPDDAAYKCDECERRFFWASGLRAHSRSHAAGRARAALACPWPGCGRVFRQPCRLREHSRAHTGDKPYHCRHPNCGWSFRTASKLLRHSRRHTGDRRHACAACGRAFLRREHLREHAARHHAPARLAPHAPLAPLAPHAPHACPRTDCEHSFTNMNSLYTHIKKVHRKEDCNDVDDPVPDEEQNLAKPANMFMVNLWDGSPVLELIEEKKDMIQDIPIESNGDVDIELQIEDATDVVDIEGVTPVQGMMEVTEEMDLEGEGHSARTHCTWPLTQKVFKNVRDEYVLEDDVQVEPSEGSESNIYTVRSDLFLHSSVFHNEDSEQMCGARPALDADLLLDAPPAALAPEEFYTDAVDESSFRVFLLSGEELT